jgi:transcription termination factor Rho
MAADAPKPHLADLHERAAEAGISGYRKLTRPELLEALGEAQPDADPAAPGRHGAGGAGVVVEGAILEPAGDEPAVEVDGTGPIEADEDVPTVEVGGVLELTRQRFGFLRLGGLVPGDDDVYISAAQVRRCELRPGDHVAGPAREPRRGERHRALVHVDLVNGEPPEADEARPAFDDLAPALPERRVELDAPGADVLVRAVDLFAPLALGQRVLVRAAARSGRTTLLRALARAAAGADARAIVLLVDERPEEAPAWRDGLPEAEFAIATADLAPTEQVRIADLATERARRLAEAGTDVILVCDSLSRLAHAAGGIDEVKRLFGTGRNLAGAGSATVIATTLADGSDEGAAERAVITTESSLVTLDPELAAAGVYPAIDATECRISNEEDLRDAEELEAVRRLRSLLSDLDPPEAAALLRERIEGSATNADLLSDLR